MQKKIFLILITLLIIIMLFLYISIDHKGKLLKVIENSPTINSQGDKLINRKEGYEVVYLPQFNQFIISITGKPFLEIKQRAEKEFVDLIGVDNKIACTLNVTIGTPYFANPKYAGKEYKLSFCK